MTNIPTARAEYSTSDYFALGNFFNFIYVKQIYQFILLFKKYLALFLPNCYNCVYSHSFKPYLFEPVYVIWEQRFSYYLNCVLPNFAEGFFMSQMKIFGSTHIVVYEIGLTLLVLWEVLPATMCTICRHTVYNRISKLNLPCILHD